MVQPNNSQVAQCGVLSAGMAITTSIGFIQLINAVDYSSINSVLPFLIMCTSLFTFIFSLMFQFLVTK
jgi:hypothetical protein